MLNFIPHKEDTSLENKNVCVNIHFLITVGVNYT